MWLIIYNIIIAIKKKKKRIYWTYFVGVSGHSSKTRERSNSSSHRLRHGSDRRHSTSTSRHGEIINFFGFLVKHRSGTECFLELVEGTASFGVPGQRLGPMFLTRRLEVSRSYWSCWWTSCRRQTPRSIAVPWWMWAVANSLLPVPSSGPREWRISRWHSQGTKHGVTVELTILELEVQMVFPKFLEDLHHMVVMFGLVLGID